MIPDNRWEADDAAALKRALLQLHTCAMPRCRGALVVEPDNRQVQQCAQCHARYEIPTPTEV